MVVAPEVPSFFRRFEADLIVMQVPRIIALNGRAAMASVKIHGDKPPGNAFASIPDA
jgi:hypothetical protein